MKRTQKTLTSIAIASMAISLIPLNVLAVDAFPTRISGDTAVQTAVQITEQTGWTGTAILASSTSNGMVDAITAGPLATLLKAPILLTDASDVLNADTQAELIKLKVTTVFVTSGTGVIRQGVLDQLIGMGITVVPLGGADRFATAANIANKMVSYGAKVNKVAVAYGWKNQDALSIASIASAQAEPILLTETDSIPASIAEFMTANTSVRETDVIGGAGVISDGVKDQFPNATRYSGADAYATNLAVLNAFNSVLKYDHVFIANGETAIDALSGAPLAAKYNAGIVLTNGVANPGTVYMGTKLSSTSVVTALGGTAVVPEDVRKGIADAAPVGVPVGVPGGVPGGAPGGGGGGGGGSFGGAIAVVNKVPLSEAISTANTLLASKTVGSAVGNITQVAKINFQAAIDTATNVNNNSNATQAQVDGQIVALATASNNLYAAVTGAGAAITGFTGTLQLGETTTTRATTTEAGAGSWTSSDTTVATVDGSTGVVTALTPGTTMITYTSSINGHVNSQVIIVYAAATVTNLTIGGAQVGAGNVTPTGFTPADASQSISWKSSVPASATINATTGVITPVAQGSTTISYALVETVTGRVVARGSLPIAVKASGVAGAAITGLDRTLQIGGTTSVTAVTTEANAIWSSSTPAVATVDVKGVVTALTAGTTTISYTTSSSGHVNSQAITVYPAATLLNPTINVVQVGKGNVTPTGYQIATSGQTIVWNSSAPAIATINATTGVITPVAEGNTLISYTVAETASGRIVVKGSTLIAVQAASASVTLNKTSMSLLIGKNETLIPTVLQATNTAVTWSSSNPLVATVDNNGNVIAVGAGIPAIITATTVVGNITATCAVTVYTEAMAIDLFNQSDYDLMTTWMTSFAPALDLKLKAYNALSLDGQSVVRSALSLASGLTTKEHVQAAIDAAILAWHEPAAPVVTNDDINNTVSGISAGMEYSLDGDPYVAYDSTEFVNSFPGDHTLLVRVAMDSSNPASADTELAFTAP